MNGKKLAGEKAVEYVEDGMLLGLGTGTTVYWSILKLGELVKNGLTVHCASTSKKTENLAVELGISLINPSELSELDLTIDGADEFDENFNLIKGGGGALLREKIVASISRRFVVVVDDTKFVSVLGGFPLPVEIVPFSWNAITERIAKLGCIPTLRKEKAVPFITDNGNYILDCRFNAINEPAALNTQLHTIPGVVETGLFVRMADVVVVGSENSVDIRVRTGDSQLN